VFTPFLSYLFYLPILPKLFSFGAIFTLLLVIGRY
jgi:hypothetical protein